MPPRHPTHPTFRNQQQHQHGPAQQMEPHGPATPESTNATPINGSPINAAPIKTVMPHKAVPVKKSHEFKQKKKGRFVDMHEQRLVAHDEVAKNKRHINRLPTTKLIGSAEDFERAPLPTKLLKLEIPKRAAKEVNQRGRQEALEEEQSCPRNHYRTLLVCGLLAATDRVNISFPEDYVPSPHDVIVGVKTSPTVNVDFPRLLKRSTLVFQSAIKSRQPEDVKRLVKGILGSVTTQGGHFVTPLSRDGRWCEVNRNVAEHFVLEELRTCLAEQRKKMQSRLLPCQQKRAGSSSSSSSRAPLSDRTEKESDSESETSKQASISSTNNNSAAMTRRVTPPVLNVSSEIVALDLLSEIAVKVSNQGSLPESVVTNDSGAHALQGKRLGQ